MPAKHLRSYLRDAAGPPFFVTYISARMLAAAGMNGAGGGRGGGRGQEEINDDDDDGDDGNDDGDNKEVITQTERDTDNKTVIDNLYGGIEFISTYSYYDLAV